MTKIHILGGPGSGKTTFAQAIASRVRVPHYDLDLLQAYGVDVAPYVDDAFAIARQPGWVAEGVFVLFIAPLLEQAEAIVLLDVAWPPAARRMLRRHVVNSLRGTNRYPGVRPLANLLRYARRYYLNRRPDTAEAIRRYLSDPQAGARPPTPASVLRQVEMHPALVIPPTAAFVRQYLAPYSEKVVLVKNGADAARLLTRLTTRRALDDRARRG